MKALYAVLAVAAIALPVLANTGIYKYESVRGRYRVCHYDVLGSHYALTIKSSEECPLFIEVNL